MNKKPVIVLSIFMMLFIFAILFYLNQEKEFDDLLGTKEANVTEIYMKDGSNGTSVETADKERIKQFINLWNARYYKKSHNQDDKTKYHYYYDLHTEDNRIIRIAGDGSRVEINNIHYDVGIPIALDLLTNWFESLSVNDAYSITFKGESKDWIAEYKVDAKVTAIDKNGLNLYAADKSLIVIYKNELADLSEVKKWEISCKYIGGE